MPVTIEKARLNIWNLGGFVLGLVFTAFGWGVTYNQSVNANAEAVRQINFVTAEIKDIKTQLPAITQLQFQMTTTTQLASENKKGIEEANRRLDRVVESFGGKLDKLVETVSNVAADVKVLTVQSKDRAQPTSFTVGN